ncbi:polysaccharide deacetylase family protein [Nocardia cyriacigeorgica]|jgi:peptidoglycan-N-acetylglucosamine deacetylase|uniref:polysaccharide deacetylase family protein n=1 Tax=Nocardia cyriacigeorgica TaxID=135487 RepID=UPI000CEA27EB|nr:polysaccharide deacetylase family protein [Nocardia cyriacigeorgica]AVH21890.1 polysaccharide deacetylase [Nocardia cyriacigeorgica]MBF6085624.1 polysaccharide deacetylase family protein [Nocardia cyriacigeorgica]MBF6091713.1 polysaccharide deacetylase family protein [Nocardia cyriacigeorgica]MBF6394651.1 polysaccharide deacetylase family protein [Nocardia cyriacigeorgica]MBF6400285.1 polysaccharide deacetylase family protein [Nocardia cyriacigeorgica]
MKRRALVGAAVILVVVVVLAVGGYYLMNSRTFQFAGRIVDRVDTDDKVVALTLDDGPTTKAAEVLKVLADAEVPATFYLNGRDLALHPEFGAAIAAAGHEIGNHTYTHRRMVFVTPGTVADEVGRTDAAIRTTGYQGPITFRPPYGKKLWTLPKYLSDHDTTTVMWDVEPDSDPSASAEQIVAQTVREVRPGSIILLHVMFGNRANSLAAIPGIVAALKADGYRFVRVSELLRE